MLGNLAIGGFLKSLPYVGLSLPSRRPCVSLISSRDLVLHVHACCLYTSSISSSQRPDHTYLISIYQLLKHAKSRDKEHITVRFHASACSISRSFSTTRRGNGGAPYALHPIFRVILGFGEISQSSYLPGWSGLDSAHQMIDNVDFYRIPRLHSIAMLLVLVHYYSS